EAAARRLGRAGAEVELVSRAEERLEELRTEIETDGGQACVHAADLAYGDAAEALVDEVLGCHGPVDVLVSNAGHSIRRSIGRSYDRFHDFQRTIDVNYLGPVRLVLGFLPGMRQ